MDYKDFRHRAAPLVEERPEWRELATFVPNKQAPVHNWFYYKEGFARDLVFNILDMFGAKEGSTVLDPFCGSGTTLLACKELGIDAAGFDALPISVFAARTKANDYELEALKLASRHLAAERFERLRRSEQPLMKRAFSRYALEDIAFLRSRIDALAQPQRDFFALALVRAALRCSYARKDGSALRFVKRPVPPLRPMCKRIVKRMLSDVKRMETKPCAISVEEGDARMLRADDESVDFVITSPPYLNQIDYQNVYAVESITAGVPLAPKAAVSFVRSSPHDTARGEYRSIAMPASAAHYFEDMEKALAEMHRVLREGGKAAIVIGNGYAGEVIESDMLLAYAADAVGFDVKKIFVLNTRFALEERTQKRGLLRESMVVLKK